MDRKSLGFSGALVIFAAAVAIRVSVWRDLADEVLFIAPQLDAREALDWALRVAGGDLSLPSYPTRGFLHPFVLGGLLAACGGSLGLVRLVQLLIASFGAVLSGVVASRSWGRREGLATGLLLACYGPLAFVDVFFWEESLLVFLLFASLSLLTRPGLSIAAASFAGVLAGAAICVRPTALTVLALWSVKAADRTRGARRARVAFALAGFSVAASGMIAVSLAAGFFLPIRGYGGLNLWMGNRPEGGGLQSAPIGGAWDRIEAAPFRAGVTDLADYDRWYLREAVTRAAHDAAGTASVLASKAVWLISSEEPRDSQSFHYFRELSPTLKWLPGFALLLGLAGVGALAAARGRGWPALALWGGAGLAFTVIVTVAGFRYRLPIAALLAPLAGLGAATLVENLRARRWRRLGVELLILLSVVTASSLRRHPASHRFGEELAQAGLSHLGRGELAEAERSFGAAAAADPRSALGPDGLGVVALARGRSAEARSQFAEAVRRDPDFQRAQLHLADLALRDGRLADARSALEASYEIGPRHLPTLERLSTLLASSGELDRAAELARRMTDIIPRSTEAWLSLARIEGARGGFEAAFSAAARAQELSPTSREPRLLEGYLALAVNDAGRALATAAALPASDASFEARLLRAGARALSGDRRAADLELRALVRERPGNPQARSLLLSNADRIGERAAAEQFLLAL